ncbi:cupredoxin domain-containing protein [Streptomyces sp. E11-3]|uniref:cupredoxin domain-containing protein n=1 Tax=Streptomyces sp. E11-3 TaxID=3110112 RepID=UPI0039802EDE
MGRFARRVALPLVVVLLIGAAAGCGGRPTTHHKPGTSHEEAEGPVGELLDTRDQSGHRYRQVAKEGAPEVALTVRPDTQDGWNLHLSVRNFRFTPDSVGGAALHGTGHAHLYLDGRKVARLYAAWHHLPGRLVAKGTHELTVRLYADDHTPWAVDGKPIESTAKLTDSGTSGTSGSDHDHPEGDEADRTVEITVADGKVNPAPGRVDLKKGQRVRLKVTSDRADTLHVHGYDKETPLRAGDTATLTFTADRTGLFEVETHASKLVLTQLAVR